MFTENIVSHMRQASGRRKYRRNAAGTCSLCGAPHERKGQRYCVGCHAAYMRNWRKSHPLTAEQRKKDRCRAYSYTYFKRGKIHKEQCGLCGSSQSQMHHRDYSKPLEVEWLCRPCHLAIHRGKRENEEETSDKV